MLKGYYSDIEQFPLQNWLNCNNGDLRFTRVRIAKGNRNNDLSAWETLYNDFLQRVGPSDEFSELIDMLIERAKLQREYLQTFQNGTRVRRKLNAINELTSRIRNFHQTGRSEKTMSVSKILNLISKQQGYQVQIKDLTVLAYFELLKQFNNGNE
jgi:hypothetical protein